MMPTFPKTRVWGAGLTALVAAVAAALSGGVTQAALIATESFEDYAPGDGLDGKSGGSGSWSGSWSAASGAANTSVVSGGLSFSSGDVAHNGGSVALQTQYGSEDITDGLYHRPLPTQTDTLYMSLLFRDTVNDDETGSGDLGGADDFVQWGFDNNTDNPNASILRRNGALQARSGTTNGDDSGFNAMVGQTFLLVFKAEKSTGATEYDEVSLFVNPNSTVEPGTPDALDSGDSGVSSVSNFVARSAFHEDGDTFVIDDIRIGTTFGDVVVPEPSALVLAVLASLALFLATRRRGRVLSG